MSRGAIAALIGLALMILGAVVFGGPIVRYWQGQTVKAQAKAETATDTAVSKTAEAEAQTVLGDKQGQITEQVIERHTETVRYVEKANAAPDANSPLGPDRDTRMREHDDSLCQQRPAVCGRGAGAEGAGPGLR